MPEPTVEVSLARIQTDPNASADPVATAYFSKATTIDGQTFQAPWAPVSWSLQSTKTVVVDGVEYPYYLGSQIITAIAYQEYAEMTAPAPVEEPAPVEPPAP